ncbi:lipoprotein insertase outer membrane protein LolB [Glaciecola sp. XM2]|uniref:lipoprotein insertase outer membrane protein LolB n=1 Tax=Glaciecola sp. XM2 TaxID=1914931 RepID=UPI001BDF0E4F|nr:lipoprotein insertase outer membrane protein LolB [Glaciecola sp. XM2]MBT1451021.1 lipoprotein insertase outer membrane protein LolB [Glaciecola sp. XM2]
MFNCQLNKDIPIVAHNFPFHKIIALSCILFFSGCAIRPTDVSLEQVQQGKIESLSRWQANGKLAVITPDERKSANLTWRQDAQQVDMLLTTVVGSSIANLSFDGKIATLDADDRQWQDTSASSLIYQVTGWQVPIEQLSKWMKGQVDSKLIEARFDNDLVKRFTTASRDGQQWQIEYTRYGEFSIDGDDYTLPTAMRLLQVQTNTRLIVRIDKWK